MITVWKMLTQRGGGHHILLVLVTILISSHIKASELAQRAACSPNWAVAVDTRCYWAPNHTATDFSDTFAQCHTHGGRPFVFGSLEEATNITTLLGVGTVEVYVPAIYSNGSYYWFSVANQSLESETFFSTSVTDHDVSYDCVTLLASQFHAQDCSSSFRFVCQTETSHFHPLPSPDQNTTANNSSTQCVPQDDGSCIPFEDMLLGVFGRLREDTLDKLLNKTGTDLGDVMRGRYVPPPQKHTPLTVIRVLQGKHNASHLTPDIIDGLDVSNLTHEETEHTLDAILNLLEVNNSAKERKDDRVAALLFRLAYVSFVDQDILWMFTRGIAMVIRREEQTEEQKEVKQSGMVLQTQAVRVLQSMEHILTADIHASNTSRHHQPLTQLELRMKEVTMNSTSHDVTLASGLGQKKNIIRVSRSLFGEGGGNVSSVTYSNLHRMLPGNRKGALKGGKVASHVVSVVVRHARAREDERHTSYHGSHRFGDFTINITLPFLFTENQSLVEKRWCVYWKFKMGVWSEDGCWVLDQNHTHTTCTCNHLSTFAVLVTFIEPEQVSADEERVMFVMTAVGCSLSISGLALTLFTFLYLRILLRERILIHANLALALLLAQVVFMSSDSARHNEVACKAVAALLHFLFMASFSWMLVEGVALYRTCTRGLLYSCDMRLKYVLLGWGLPVLVVVISLGLEFPNYGRGLHNTCWLSVEEGLIWAFLGPMLIIVTLNVLILVLVIRVFLTLRANSQKSEAARARAGVRAMVMLLPLLGTTWLLSLLLPVSSVFGYLFILCNSLQGLLIFILHCLSNEEVRRFLARKRGPNRSRTRTSESNLSIVGLRRRSPARFDNVKLGMMGRNRFCELEGRRNAWV